MFWLVCALLVGLFWSLAALRHTLLQSNGFDLGIYDQVAWQMSQGLEPRSTLIKLHHMGNHGAWVFYAITPLYWLAPSVHWLFLTQAVGLILTAWPLWHVAAQAGLKVRWRWLICGLWWLQPVVFNVNLFDFHPETWAMPLLALAIWANRAERRWLWLACLFAAMGCRDGLSLVVIGFALEQALRRRWRWAGEALLLGGGWLLLMAKGLYPILNDGAGPAALGRYAHLGDGVGGILHNAVFNPAELLSALDVSGIFRYIFVLIIPLAFYWRRSSLPLLAATLPLLASNLLSSSPAQRDLVHQYSLPLAVLLVVASVDGWSADLRQGRLWLTRRLWLGYFWAALCWALLAKPGHSLVRYLSRINQIQAAQDLIQRVPPDAAVLTQSYLAPQLTHRPILRQAFIEYAPTEANLAQLDVALLSPNDPGWKSSVQHIQSIIAKLKDMGWRCEENGAFTLCQKVGK